MMGLGRSYTSTTMSMPSRKTLSLFFLLVGTATTISAFIPRSNPQRQTFAAASALQAQKTAVIAGATGYIGKSVVREAVRQGYQTIALVRDKSSSESESFGNFFDGAQVIECDVSNVEKLQTVMQEIADDSPSKKIDAIVSCLASRSGVKKDAYLIDYQATLNCLDAGRAVGAGHFVMLSAFCVKNPWLQFQQAKLKFEAALQEQTDMTWSIIRPTAYFKSLSMQLEIVKGGKPYVLFEDGKVTRCNPIAESELAEYLMDCVTDKTRHNIIRNLGGPDNAITQSDQGAMMFKALGMEPEYSSAPLWVFDPIIDFIQWFANLSGLEQLEDAAETCRIGKYYAVEEMLTTDPIEKYGKITLQQHYNRIAVEGQEFDKYTNSFARARVGIFGGEDKDDKAVNDAAAVATTQEMVEMKR
jgi:divinyl chlorophyllide a 8-vinyl-reductase